MDVQHVRTSDEVAGAPPRAPSRTPRPHSPFSLDGVADPRLDLHGPALLALEDGLVLEGAAVGAPVATFGDVVVNTSHTGYQEVCSDPSYAGQIVALTFPLVGNHGCIEGDDQSVRPWLRALVVGQATASADGRSRQLVHRLRRSGVPAIAGIDTRLLARHLRRTGARRAWITAPFDLDAERAVASARCAPRWEDQDFIDHVSVSAVYEVGAPGSTAPLVAVLDFGLKHAIVEALVAGGVRVRVLPHTATREAVLADDVAGVVLSPGPGDPARLRETVALAAAVLEDGRPLLGICLGHQIVGLAAGARTRRLEYGHHGGNHPVQDVDTGVVRMTAQNHEVEVVGDSIPTASGLYVSRRNLNDGSVEGLRHASLPIETVQYHPEGAPGPRDDVETFARFIANARATAAAHGPEGRAACHRTESGARPSGANR